MDLPDLNALTTELKTAFASQIDTRVGKIMDGMDLPDLNALTTELKTAFKDQIAVKATSLITGMTLIDLATAHAAAGIGIELKTMIEQQAKTSIMAITDPAKPVSGASIDPVKVATALIELAKLTLEVQTEFVSKIGPEADYLMNLMPMSLDTLSTLATAYGAASESTLKTKIKEGTKTKIKEGTIKLITDAQATNLSILAQALANPAIAAAFKTEIESQIKQLIAGRKGLIKLATIYTDSIYSTFKTEILNRANKLIEAITKPAKESTATADDVAKALTELAKLTPEVQTAFASKIGPEASSLMTLVTSLSDLVEAHKALAAASHATGTAGDTLKTQVENKASEIIVGMSIANLKNLDAAIKAEFTPQIATKINNSIGTASTLDELTTLAALLTSLTNLDATKKTTFETNIGSQADKIIKAITDPAKESTATADDVAQALKTLAEAYTDANTATQFGVKIQLEAEDLINKVTTLSGLAELASEVYAEFKLLIETKATTLMKRMPLNDLVVQHETVTALRAAKGDEIKGMIETQVGILVSTMTTNATKSGIAAILAILKTLADVYKTVPLAETTLREDKIKPGAKDLIEAIITLPELAILTSDVHIEFKPLIEAQANNLMITMNLTDLPTLATAHAKIPTGAALKSQIEKRADDIINDSSTTLPELASAFANPAIKAEFAPQIGTRVGKIMDGMNLPGLNALAPALKTAFASQIDTRVGKIMDGMDLPDLNALTTELKTAFASQIDTRVGKIMDGMDLPDLNALAPALKTAFKTPFDKRVVAAINTITAPAISGSALDILKAVTELAKLATAVQTAFKDQIEPEAKYLITGMTLIDLATVYVVGGIGIELKTIIETQADSIINAAATTLLDLGAAHAKLLAASTLKSKIETQADSIINAAATTLLDLVTAYADPETQTAFGTKIEGRINTLINGATVDNLIALANAYAMAKITPKFKTDINDKITNLIDGATANDLIPFAKALADSTTKTEFGTKITSKATDLIINKATVDDLIPFAKALADSTTKAKFGTQITPKVTDLIAAANVTHLISLVTAQAVSGIDSGLKTNMASKATNLIGSATVGNLITLANTFAVTGIDPTLKVDIGSKAKSLINGMTTLTEVVTVQADSTINGQFKSYIDTRISAIMTAAVTGIVALTELANTFAVTGIDPTLKANIGSKAESLINGMTLPDLATAYADSAIRAEFEPDIKVQASLRINGMTKADLSTLAAAHKTFNALGIPGNILKSQIKAQVDKIMKDAATTLSDLATAYADSAIKAEFEPDIKGQADTIIETITKPAKATTATQADVAQALKTLAGAYTDANTKTQFEAKIRPEATNLINKVATLSGLAKLASEVYAEFKLLIETKASSLMTLVTSLSDLVEAHKALAAASHVAGTAGDTLKTQVENKASEIIGGMSIADLKDLDAALKTAFASQIDTRVGKIMDGMDLPGLNALTPAIKAEFTPQIATKINDSIGTASTLDELTTLAALLTSLTNLDATKKTTFETNIGSQADKIIKAITDHAKPVSGASIDPVKVATALIELAKLTLEVQTEFASKIGPEADYLMNLMPLSLDTLSTLVTAYGAASESTLKTKIKEGTKTKIKEGTIKLITDAQATNLSILAQALANPAIAAAFKTEIESQIKQLIAGRKGLIKLATIYTDSIYSTFKTEILNRANKLIEAITKPAKPSGSASADPVKVAKALTKLAKLTPEVQTAFASKIGPEASSLMTLVTSLSDLVEAHKALAAASYAAGTAGDTLKTQVENKASEIIEAITAAARASGATSIVIAAALTELAKLTPEVQTAFASKIGPEASSLMTLVTSLSDLVEAHKALAAASHAAGTAGDTLKTQVENKASEIIVGMSIADLKNLDAAIKAEFTPQIATKINDSIGTASTLDELTTLAALLTSLTNLDATNLDATKKTTFETNIGSQADKIIKAITDPAKESTVTADDVAQALTTLAEALTNSEVAQQFEGKIKSEANNLINSMTKLSVLAEALKDTEITDKFDGLQSKAEDLIKNINDLTDLTDLTDLATAYAKRIPLVESAIVTKAKELIGKLDVSSLNDLTNTTDLPILAIVHAVKKGSTDRADTTITDKIELKAGESMKAMSIDVVAKLAPKIQTEFIIPFYGRFLSDLVFNSTTHAYKLDIKAIGKVIHDAMTDSSNSNAVHIVQKEAVQGCKHFNDFVKKIGAVVPEAVQNVDTTTPLVAKKSDVVKAAEEIFLFKAGVSSDQIDGVMPALENVDWKQALEPQIKVLDHAKKETLKNGLPGNDNKADIDILVDIQREMTGR